MIANVSAALLLSGCAALTSSTPLPEPIAPLQQCAAIEPTQLPEGDMADGGYSEKMALSTLSWTRVSELAQDRCADMWAAWYDDLLKG